MLTLYLLVLRMATLLVPTNDPIVRHGAFATAVVEEISETGPLFRDDASGARSAALLVAIGFRESTLRNDVESPTHDSCALQINRRPDLKEDVRECVRVGVKMLRESMRMCRDYPVAFYASGPGACENARARAISNDRMAMAKKVLASAKSW